MADRALHVDRKVGGAGADIHQHHAQLAFVGGQHRHRRCQRRQHQIVDLQAALLHALGDVGRRRLRAHHQVRMHLQAHAGHADRVADAFLRIVQHVLARNRMQDALIGRNGHGLGGIEHALQIAPGHFAIADRHDAGRVLALHVVAGNRGVHRADLATGHQLGLFHCTLDRLHGGFDVHHHAALETARFMRTDADHFDRIAGRVLADQRDDLGSADVQSNDEGFVAFAIHVLKPGIANGEWGMVNSGARMRGVSRTSG